MSEKNEEWLFLQLRAAQLFDEGETGAALRIMKRINQYQAMLFKQMDAEYEQTENC